MAFFPLVPEFGTLKAKILCEARITSNRIFFFSLMTSSFLVRGTAGARVRARISGIFPSARPQSYVTVDQHCRLLGCLMETLKQAWHLPGNLEPRECHDLCCNRQPPEPDSENSANAFLLDECFLRALPWCVFSSQLSILPPLYARDCPNKTTQVQGIWLSTDTPKT